MTKLFTLTFFIVINCVFLTNKSVAQEQKYNVETTVDFINGRLSEENKFKISKKSIQIEFIQNGKVVRIDDFDAESIDFEKSIKYNANSSSIELTCYPMAKDCIRREIFIRDSKQYHSSTSIKTSCQESDCQSLERAIFHLLMLYAGDKDYTRTKPFDEE